MPKPDNNYSFDDVQSDIMHLAHLLDETMEKVQELDFTADSQSSFTANRVSALLWIARDMTERLEKQLSENMQSLRNGGRNAQR